MYMLTCIRDDNLDFQSRAMSSYPSPSLFKVLMVSWYQRERPIKNLRGGTIEVIETVMQAI